MSTPARLGLYAAGLVVVFAVLFVAGRALVPDSTVAEWVREADEREAGHGEMTGEEGGHDPAGQSTATTRGLSLSQEGFTLGPVKAPKRAGERGRMSFRILGPGGEPFTAFAESHEKELHLITVRSDGSHFRHVHPRLERESGTWSIPWSWPAGGSYRVFADFVPSGTGDEPNLTLARNLEVAGEFKPAYPALSDTDHVDGFEVRLDGELVAGESRELTVRVSRNGSPVTSLEPYLGAFGHLVALREGDLAYLHVHAEGEDPGAGQTAGPEIGFETEAPTPGRYLLYLDFKVGGEVHTARFVIGAR